MCAGREPGVRGLSALIKYTTVLVGLFYLMPGAVRFLRGPSAYCGSAATGVVVAAMTSACSGRGSTSRVRSSRYLRAADGKSWQFSNSAPDVIAMHIDNKLLNPPSLDPAAENHFYLYGDIYETPTTASTRSRLKLITRALFAHVPGLGDLDVCGVWPAIGRARSVEPILRASVRAFTVLILVVFTWVLEWYWMWPLALATLLGWRNMLTKLVVHVLAVRHCPIFYAHHYWNWHMPSGFVLLYAFPPLAVPVSAWLSQACHACDPQLKPALMPTAVRVE